MTERHRRFPRSVTRTAPRDSRGGAQEEAEAAQDEVTEKAAALDVPLHPRIDRELDAQLRRQTAEAHVPTSALVPRLLRQVLGPRSQFTTADLERIARRVAREELHRA